MPNSTTSRRKLDGILIRPLSFVSPDDGGKHRHERQRETPGARYISDLGEPLNAVYRAEPVEARHLRTMRGLGYELRIQAGSDYTRKRMARRIGIENGGAGRNRSRPTSASLTGKCQTINGQSPSSVCAPCSRP